MPSDWIHGVVWLAERVEKKLASGQPTTESIAYAGQRLPLAAAQACCGYVLEHYAGIWAEAMLWASIEFIGEELGLPVVFYHREPGGRLLKGVRCSAPPRSRYTDLLCRFCFTPTREVPPFLADDREVRRLLRQNPAVEFFRLAR